MDAHELLVCKHIKYALVLVMGLINVNDAFRVVRMQ